MFDLVPGTECHVTYLRVDRDLDLDPDLDLDVGLIWKQYTENGIQLLYSNLTGYQKKKKERHKPHVNGDRNIVSTSIYQ